MISCGDIQCLRLYQKKIAKINEVVDEQDWQLTYAQR
jgi:hypothetical protein